MTEMKKGTIHWHGVDEKGVRTNGAITINNYPSGEPLISFPRGAYVEKILVRPVSMLDFMAALFFVDALRERGHTREIELLLPFVPGARQDRLNSEGDFLFTAKSIAREINARDFWRVVVLDPHSDVTPALISKCFIVHAHECFRYGMRHEEPYSAVISPDAGAEKRAGAVAKLLGVPMLHGWKTRDVATGKITGFGLERSETTGHVLVVDDICDGGGTFIGLAGVLKTRSLKADLFVTHGLFSQGTQKLRDHYATVLCTDSLDIDRPGVEVIPVSKRLFEGTST